jgi:competence protein ComEC
MHKSQTFFYVLLSFIGGVFAGSFFNIPVTVVLVIMMVCIALVAVFFRRDSKLLNPIIALAAFFTIFFVVGVLRFNAVNSKQHALSEIATAAAQLVNPDKRPVKVDLYGYVNGEPEIKNGNQQFVFYSKILSANPYEIKTDEQVLITAKSYPRYSYGQQIKITARLELPKNSQDFDYKSYLAKNGIFTLANYPDISPVDAQLSFLENVKVSIFKIIFSIKDKFEQSVGRSVAQPNAAFINGILLGTTSQLPAEIKNDFSRTSTSHILAVSGYNITIVALVISWFFLLFLRRPVAFWFSFAGVILFTILTGAQASVVRAAIMGMLILVANRTGRLNDPRNAIVLAGAVMIFLNPQILRHDIGFQLSFGATLGIIYVSPIFERYFSKIPNIFGVRETLTMTLSAQVFVLPLLLYYFKNLSLTSLPANILVLPTIPFAMLLGFLTGVAGLIWPFLGQVVGYFAWLITTVELWVIKLLAKPSWATVSIGFSWYAVILIYIIFISLIIWLNSKNRKNDNSK